MLEEEAYQTMWNLLESIPSLENPNISVRQETVEFNERVKTEDHARLIDSNHTIIDAAVYGFNAHDRLDLLRLMATTEHSLGARRIDEMFSEHFFTTNFWQMWRTTFAFQNWHSAIELKRYFRVSFRNSRAFTRCRACGAPSTTSTIPSSSRCSAGCLRGVSMCALQTR